MRARVLFYFPWTLLFFAAAAVGAARQNGETDPIAPALLGVAFLALAARYLHHDFITLRYHGRVFRAERPVRFWIFLGLLAVVGLALTVISAHEFGLRSA